jgi:hypothetical protein
VLKFEGVLRLCAILSFLFLCGFSIQSRALTFDVNAFYYTDDLTAASTTVTSRMIWDFAIMLNLDRKGRVVMGWSYGSVAATDETASVTEYTSTEMGPRFGYYIDKNYLWSVFFTYNLVSTADFTTGGGTTEEWRGTTMRGEFGYTPIALERFLVGIKLIYYKATYNEQVTGTTTLATNSYGRAMIYPSLSFVYKWD